jgi:uncharacterized protein (TIGR02001 family)
MKKSLFALSLVTAITALPSAALADIAYNIGAFTDYRYRGISQTRVKPAIQAGVDFTQGAFYLGAWASNIKWIKDVGGDASVEIDLYGGYKGEIAKDLTYDVGVLAYVYPGNKLSTSANTTEIYAAITSGPFTAKYSHSLTNTFANPDSKSSWYLDLSATFEVSGGWNLVPHLGRQKISGPASGVGSYTDYSLTLSKDFKGLVPSIALVGTDADKGFYSSPVGGKRLGKSALVLGLKYNF